MKNRKKKIDTILKPQDDPLGQYFRIGRDLNDTTEKFKEDIAPLIGHIVQKFNSLNANLEVAICDLFSKRSHELGAIVLCKMSYQDKVKLLDVFLKEREFNEKKRGDLKSYLIDVGECRNAVIHALYESDDESYFYSELKKGKMRLEERYIKITPEGLEEIKDLIDFVIEIFDQYEDEWSGVYDN